MKEGPINNLERLLLPRPAEEFLRDTWGKNYEYIKGGRGKFAHLLPWGCLNEILGQHRLDFPRLRLALDGKSLPSSAYLRHTRSARQRTLIPRLLSNELTARLREGATLVLDAVDELHAPLRELAEGLEYLFRERVQINAYAGWQTTRGFDLHFDDHDVFILQVAGRKLWKVYGETKRHPLPQDRGAAEKPKGEPLWEGTLSDGDLLYMPRGWWHVAMPQAEPTLHLTVGVHNRTGLDLLRWLSNRMGASEAFRRDLPRFSSPEERREHAALLRGELLAGWDDQLLDRYLEEYDAEAYARPSLNFPWSVAGGRAELRDETLLRLRAPRPLNFKEGEGVIEFNCNGKRWKFAAAAGPLLRALSGRRVCTVSELRRAGEGLDPKTFDAFLRELLHHDLITPAED